MTIWNAIILGIVQGITEFLPISSSGHLAILQNLFGMSTAENGHLFFDVMLHFGTLISLCTVFWSDITRMIREYGAQRRSTKRKKGPQKRYSSVRQLGMILIATIPMIIIVPFRHYIERLYYYSAYVGFALIMTGFALYAADHLELGNKTHKDMTIKDALVIGLCQAAAIIPGLSRSGLTIAAGFSTGLKKNYAVKFSFLISIVAVFGAAVFSLIDAIQAGVLLKYLPAYLIGMAVSAIVGIFAINFVRNMVNEGKLGSFSYYCWVIGVLTIILTFIF